MPNSLVLKVVSLGDLTIPISPKHLVSPSELLYLVKKFFQLFLSKALWIFLNQVEIYIGFIFFMFTTLSKLSFLCILLYPKFNWLSKHLNLWPSEGFDIILPKWLLGIMCSFVWSSWPQWSHLYLFWMLGCPDFHDYYIYSQLSLPWGRVGGKWGARSVFMCIQLSQRNHSWT